MKNKVVAVLGMVAGLAFGTAALAQKIVSGPYVGASVGQATSSDFCLGAGSPCKDTDVSWRLLGGYQVNRWLGVEGGVHQFGSASNPAGPNDAKGQAIEIVGVAAYALNPSFSIYGKAGGFRGRVRGSDATGASFNVSSTDVTYGLGLQWNLLDQLSLRGELQRYPRMGGGAAGPSTDYDVWSVGAIFRFQ
jgi:opacity protein-like surface antigen